MKIAVIYFSATGNTAIIADVISETLKTYPDIEVDKLDITSFSSRENKVDLSKYSGIFFGFPIYVLRAPKILREWVKALKGNTQKVSAFFTYGGVTSGISSQNIKQILEDQNFQVVSTGEFLGKHTSNLAGWSLMSEHPNQDDFDIAKEYAKKTFKRFTGEDSGLLELPSPDLSEKSVDRMEASSNKRRIPPSRQGAECSMCNICEENCPTNAMNAETGEADPEKCIGCLQCLANCPDEALKVADRSKMFAVISKAMNLSEEVLASRRSKYFL